MKNGFLVSFEGGEACGKTTQIKMFEKYLKEKKIDYLLTREPGGTEVGEKIREILLYDKSKLSSQCEFLLFSASRSKLVSDVIVPNLRNNKVVVMDRFFDSSFAYQGYAGHLKIEHIKNITDFATWGLVPDVTFLLDIPYEVGMARKNKDEDLRNLDRMESKGKAYHDAVRQGYLKIAKENPDRVVVIDASKSIDEVFTQVVANFEKRYKHSSLVMER